MSAFTATDLAEEADREVQFREFVYSRLMADGKMTKNKAKRRIDMMREIAAHFHAEAAKERLL